jgi:hypothetical protein
VLRRVLDQAAVLPECFPHAKLTERKDFDASQLPPLARAGKAIPLRSFMSLFLVVGRRRHNQWHRRLLLFLEY